MKPGSEYFSQDFAEARKRFVRAAEAAGFELQEFAIDATGPDRERLMIDAASKGPPDAPHKIVVSSGLHGVEGFFGSAAQLALLEQRWSKNTLPGAAQVILLHALNPYGFAWRRRVNEDNVDLNRNFILPDEEFSGSPEKYDELNALLNPEDAPGIFDFFTPRAGLAILKHGMPALKDAVAGGQYDYPKGLFFGGKNKTQTQRILEAELPKLIEGATDVLHLDLHTGLGKDGTYKLMVNHPAGSARARWLKGHFGEDVVEPWENSGVSYGIRGGFGQWARSKFNDVHYDVLTAEFGTYPILKVLARLRAENQAHLWGERSDPHTIFTKERLQEVFAPEDTSWRDESVSQVLDLINTSEKACFERPQRRSTMPISSFSSAPARSGSTPSARANTPHQQKRM